MEAKGLSQGEAYQVASMTADLRITQLVDRRVGVHMMVAKSVLAPPAQAPAPAPYPAPVEGDFVARHFRFSTGESLGELRLHYTTIGTPVRDAAGKVTNAVLIMHGTGGTGRGFLSPSFAGQLFGAGQLLDATKYFIILPDGIGHGKSSKPSDGLRMKFPKYTYDDMVKAQHLLITEHLGVNHLRLVMGTSMGAMHTWVWGYRYPDFMDALDAAGEQSGGDRGTQPDDAADDRRRDHRRPGVEAGQLHQPAARSHGRGARAAPDDQHSAPVAEGLSHPRPGGLRPGGPHRPLGGGERRQRHALPVRGVAGLQPVAPSGEIIAPLYAVNSADDQVNPPELGIMEREIGKVPPGTLHSDPDQRPDPGTRDPFASGDLGEVSGGAVGGEVGREGAKTRRKDAKTRG